MNLNNQPSPTSGDLSLNPGRYTGTATVDEDDVDFMGDLEALYEEFTMLSDEADVLRSKVDAAVQGILGA